MDEHRLSLRDFEEVPTVGLGRQFPEPDEDELTAMTALLSVGDQKELASTSPWTVFKRWVKPVLLGGHASQIL